MGSARRENDYKEMRDACDPPYRKRNRCKLFFSKIGKVAIEKSFTRINLSGRWSISGVAPDGEKDKAEREKD